MANGLRLLRLCLGCGQPLKGRVGKRSEYNNVYIL